jgi:hypothetical protein
MRIRVVGACHRAGCGEAGGTPGLRAGVTELFGDNIIYSITVH